MKKCLVAVSLAPVAPCLLAVFKLAGLQGRGLAGVYAVLLVACIGCAVLQPRWLKTHTSIAMLMFCWLVALYNMVGFVWRVYN